MTSPVYCVIMILYLFLVFPVRESGQFIQGTCSLCLEISVINWRNPPFYGTFFISQNYFIARRQKGESLCHYLQFFQEGPQKIRSCSKQRTALRSIFLLIIAVPRRKRDGKDDALFIHCYFNKSLADRLLNAKVKKGIMHSDPRRSGY